MRLRLALSRFVSIAPAILAIACNSDDPVSPHKPTPAPAWSEVTNLLPSTVLYGMWAPRANLVMAVGRSGQIWRWDGNLWAQLITVTGEDLYDIDGSTTGSVVAVGEHGMLIEQVQGSFVIRTIPTNESLHGVWRSSSGEFIVVGDNGVAMRGSGNTWALDATPSPSALFSVWGSGDSDVFATGVDGTIFHYDGSEWSEMQSGTTEILSAVNGTAADDVYAVGSSGTILHYDGNEWQHVTNPATQLLQSVCADCGPAAVGANGELVRMVDGTWQREKLPEDPWMYSVARAGEGLWAIGAHALYRFDGATWASDARGAIPTLRAITAHDDNGLVVAGDNGAVLLDGPKHWQFDDAGALARLNAVWTTPEGELLTAGTNRIFRYTTSGWVTENQEVVEYFDIGASATETYAVGTGGQVRRRTGTTWSKTVVGSPEDLHAIAFDEIRGYIVGNNGILLSSSSNWQATTLRAGAALWDITPVESPNWDWIVVGANGLCIGSSVVGGWSQIPTNVSTTLFSLTKGPGDYLYALGANGTVLNFVNDQWKLVPSPTSRTFLRAWSSNGTLFACGGNASSGGMLFRFGPPAP